MRGGRRGEGARGIGGGRGAPAIQRHRSHPPQHRADLPPTYAAEIDTDVGHENKCVSSYPRGFGFSGGSAVFRITPPQPSLMSEILQENLRRPHLPPRHVRIMMFVVCHHQHYPQTSILTPTSLSSNIKAPPWRQLRGKSHFEQVNPQLNAPQERAHSCGS